ncbi:MAG: lytic transglycosylase domain-containing protein [Burkholderiaceae bacterium]
MVVDFSLRSAACFHLLRKCRLAVAAAGIATGLLASPAVAQVMDIASDGTVSVREGAGATQWVVVSAASDQTVNESGSPVVLPQGAITAVRPAPVPTQYAAALTNAAASANISPVLLAALVWQESRWNAQAISRKGAIGLAQLMPATARDLGVNPMNPIANLNGAARYLRQLLDQFDGNVEKALAAYNAGAARVRSAGGVPAIAETRNYVTSIVRRLSWIGSTGGSQ